MNLDAIRRFLNSGNVLIVVSVNVKNLGREPDWGFADIKRFSATFAEEEVLFNPINIFKVVDCYRTKDRKDNFKLAKYQNIKWVVELEYGAFSELM